MILKIFLLSLALELAAPREVNKKAVATWMEQTSPYYDHCIYESNATFSELEELTKFGKVASTTTFKHFLKCIYESLNLFNTDGGFNKRILLNTFSYVTEAIADKCINSTISEEDVYEKSYLLGNCITQSI
ncbi:hypothetical protein FQA39_LY10005 [Lamprigera yunnana]|nr:hypothetical protein FQA39_LY10005 [Lamprigera yunnana]